MTEDLCNLKSKDRPDWGCCCVCMNQFEARICNCSEDWPKELVLSKSKYNKQHGLIGYACSIFSDEGIMEISRSKHGVCECFQKKSAKSLNA